MASYYLFINSTFIITGYIVGLLLFAFPVPDIDFLKSYSFSSKLLAASYILLAIINTSVLFLGLTDYQPEYFKFSGLFISSTQSLIFSYILVTLINPHLSKKANTLFKGHVLIILFFLLAYTALFLMKSDPILTSESDVVLRILHPLTLLRIAFFVFYLYQILNYSLIFIKAVGKYNISIGNYFSETGTLKLNWIKIAFYSALSIGLLAILFQTLPSLLFDNIFTTVIVVFYTVFALHFINYKKIYHLIEPALDTPKQSETEFPNTLNKSSWSSYKKKVLADKIYLKEGITLIEMAQALNVSRTTLSFFINTEEKRNFNNWINQLRISEAKTLMISNPEFSISTIATKTGYIEQSNFSREFKLVTGEAPAAWKK